MTKNSWERSLEKYQKEIQKNIKKQIDEEKKLADKQRREAKNQARITARRERAASIVNGQPIIGGMKILDSIAEELVSLICEGNCRDNYMVTNNDVVIPAYLEKDLALEFEKLKQYGLISQYGYYITGCWEITILPSLLNYFERKEKAMMENKQSYNTNNFYGNATGIQIQQGTVNSSQNQTITQGFNYEEIEKFIERIKKYEGLFDSEFGDKADELRNTITGLEELVEKRENPSKIKRLLSELKNLVVGVTGSLIASGIAAQIPLF